MFVLFEEDGAFKAGTVLADNDSSLQVETSHGKRVKLKSSHVLMRFREPAPAELLNRAEAGAEELDTAFLWEVCGDDEFAFDAFAAEYHGHAPNAVESASVLLRLHSAPIYFHRKGRGRFRKAPADILQAALVGLEKKRQQAEAIERMRADLVEGRMPVEIAGMLPQLLYRPDRNRVETKAFEAACVDTGLSAPRLLLQCGALASSYDFHYNRFLFEHFEDGTAFPAFDAPLDPADLPLAQVAAFSIDDATTTEIDDAFSITPREGGGWRIGIHIAAPALGFARGSSLDAIARRRLSTVYMPGNKITMLPDAVVETFTLAAGRDCPAVSLYLDVTAALAVQRHETVVERVPIVANLRHHDIEPLFNEQVLHDHAGGPDFEWRRELTLLWDLASVLEAGRGKAEDNRNQVDFNFYVDWQTHTADGPGYVTITQRKRGSPLDKLVAEMMILANSTWGKLLDEAGIPGLYRVQSGGKVRMSTAAGPHDGLGVDCYAWSSSPLRRYVDMVNQWQIISVLRDEAPAFAPKSTDLMAALRDFDVTYAAYADFQRQMERYWCLRWLRQQPGIAIDGKVLRDNLVRLDAIPLMVKVPSLPVMLPGTRVRLTIEHSDLLDVDISARFVEMLAEPDPADTADAALEGN
ncbi:ribonuclease catalytic domain-containing protein [Aromatoleum petrolei]|uniref:RNB domain-containing ribonuclease n=1 Tax=Aromatoleum petrolei TaxID=76116 RepID=A0ABX1MWW4_9RHOO|nr:RNB domain-containing ribonuclease [Aromatoleum petrolei]NMF91048.1 RNB domain-containing ribonuclease [Aromatoleum petrolei]QTQ35940.1 Putative exoribonuclease II [Aromatoleum petrolei]